MVPVGSSTQDRSLTGSREDAAAAAALSANKTKASIFPSIPIPSSLIHSRARYGPTQHDNKTVEDVLWGVP
jgi:hypothetical protein